MTKEDDLFQKELRDINARSDRINRSAVIAEKVLCFLLGVLVVVLSLAIARTFGVHR